MWGCYEDYENRGVDCQKKEKQKQSWEDVIQWSLTAEKMHNICEITAVIKNRSEAMQKQTLALVVVGNRTKQKEGITEWIMWCTEW